MSGSRAIIDRDAIAANVRTLAKVSLPAELCAVVKADGYGHGAVRSAEAALAGGANWLAVASVEEARCLRQAAIDAPLMVLSELEHEDIDTALAMGVRLVVYRPETIAAIEARAAHVGVPRVNLHLKVDTGMRRVGCEPEDAVGLAQRIVASDHLHLEGTMTHLAVADEPDSPTTDGQLDRFNAVLRAFEEVGIDPGIRHAANSAGTIAAPRSRYDLVRVGISIYGIPPAPDLDGWVELQPALQWVAPVRFVKKVNAGDAVSYGHRHRFPADTTVATVAAGYADGVHRSLGLTGGEVLIRGRRCPIVGVVTMDQLVVDCGPDGNVDVGDDAVLIGAQGDETITPDEWGEHLGTISYEIVCGISARVPRVTRSVDDE